MRLFLLSCLVTLMICEQIENEEINIVNELDEENETSKLVSKVDIENEE